MNEQMKRCFGCGDDYPKSQFHHDYLCPICEKKGVKIEFKVRNCTCEECGIEFTHKAASKVAKYCNRKCYMATRRAYKLDSPVMKNRICEVCGKPIGINRGHNAVTCSQECSKLRKANPTSTHAVKHAIEIKEAKAKSWKEIIKLCSKLHISYGQYQTLETLGQLDSYIAEHSDLLV